MVVGNQVMSAHGNRIWVLITDGVNTRICSCQDGMATPITTPFLNCDILDLDDRGLRAYSAWFKAEGQRRPSLNPARLHLLHVGQLLLEGARDKAYDGLIVICAEPVLAALEDALAPETRALVIGKLIRDHAGFEVPASTQPAEMRH
jgi:hypothetical protein